MALTVNTLSGYTDFQNIDFTTDFTGFKIFDFGDGKFFTTEGLTASHIYDNSGVYNATVRSCSDNTPLAINTQSISAYNFVPNAVEFSMLPLTGNASEDDGRTFEVCVSSFCPPPIEIELGVGGTISKDIFNLSSHNTCEPSHVFSTTERRDGNIIFLDNPTEIKVDDIVVGYHDKFCFGYYDDFAGDFDITATIKQNCEICPPDIPVRDECCVRVSWSGGNIDDTININYKGLLYAANNIDLIPNGVTPNPPAGNMVAKPLRLAIPKTDGSMALIGEDLVVDCSDVDSLLPYITNVDGIIAGDVSNLTFTSLDNCPPDPQAPTMPLSCAFGSEFVCLSLSSNGAISGQEFNKYGTYTFTKTLSSNGFDNDIIALSGLGGMDVVYNNGWQVLSGGQIVASLSSSDFCNPSGDYEILIPQPSWSQFSISNDVCPINPTISCSLGELQMCLNVGFDGAMPNEALARSGNYTINKYLSAGSGLADDDQIILRDLADMEVIYNDNLDVWEALSGGQVLANLTSFNPCDPSGQYNLLIPQPTWSNFNIVDGVCPPEQVYCEPIQICVRYDRNKYASLSSVGMFGGHELQGFDVEGNGTVIGLIYRLIGSDIGSYSVVENAWYVTIDGVAVAKVASTDVCNPPMQAYTSINGYNGNVIDMVLDECPLPFNDQGSVALQSLGGSLYSNGFDFRTIEPPSAFDQGSVALQSLFGSLEPNGFDYRTIEPPSAFDQGSVALQSLFGSLEPNGFDYRTIEPPSAFDQGSVAFQSLGGSLEPNNQTF